MLFASLLCFEDLFALEVGFFGLCCFLCPLAAFTMLRFFRDPLATLTEESVRSEVEVDTSPENERPFLTRNKKKSRLIGCIWLGVAKSIVRVYRKYRL